MKIDAEPLETTSTATSGFGMPNSGSKRWKSRHSAASSKGHAVLWLLRPDGACCWLAELAAWLVSCSNVGMVCQWPGLVSGGGRQLYAAPVMQWMAGGMSGVYTKSAVLDMTLFDEHYKAMWYVVTTMRVAHIVAQPSRCYLPGLCRSCVRSSGAMGVRRNRPRTQALKWT